MVRRFGERRQRWRHVPPRGMDFEYWDILSPGTTEQCWRDEQSGMAVTYLVKLISPTLWPLADLDAAPTLAWPIAFYFPGLGNTPATVMAMDWSSSAPEPFFLVVPKRPAGKWWFIDGENGWDWASGAFLPDVANLFKRWLSAMVKKPRIDVSRVAIFGFSAGAYAVTELLACGDSDGVVFRGVGLGGLHGHGQDNTAGFPAWLAKNGIGVKHFESFLERLRGHSGSPVIESISGVNDRQSPLEYADKICDIIDARQQDLGWPKTKRRKLLDAEQDSLGGSKSNKSAHNYLKAAFFNTAFFEAILGSPVGSEVDKMRLQGEAPLFNEAAKGEPLDWHDRANFKHWRTTDMQTFTRVVGAVVKVEKVIDFLSMRLGFDGKPVASRLEPAEFKGDGWYRLCVRAFSDADLPKQSAGTRSKDSDWQHAFHGQKIEGLYSTLCHGCLFASCDKSSGHTFFEGCPGVYCHQKSSKANNYLRYCALCDDGVFWAAKWELRVDRSDCVVKRDTDQWIQPQRSVRLAALWLSGLTCDEMEGGWEVSHWNSVLEAKPNLFQLTGGNSTGPDPCPKSSNVEAYVEAKRAQIAAPPGLPHPSEEDYRVRRPAASTAHPGAAIPPPPPGPFEKQPAAPKERPAFTTRHRQREQAAADSSERRANGESSDSSGNRLSAWCDHSNRQTSREPRSSRGHTPSWALNCSALAMKASTSRRTGSNAIALAKPPPFALQLTPCERETERPTWALALPAESKAPVRGRRPQPAWVTCETLPPEEGKQVIHNVAQPESQAQPMAVQEAVAEQVTTNTLIHELSSDSSSDSADTRAAVNRVRGSLRRSRQMEIGSGIS